MVACYRVVCTECGSVGTGPFEGGRHYLHYLHKFGLRASLVAQRLKHLPAMWETRV